MKKIVIDLEGSDLGATVLARGAVKAAALYPDLKFTLVATDPSILGDNAADNFEIVKADEFIGPDEPAMSIFKGRDNSSMALALKKCKEDDECIGVLSAGNTGALMVGSIFRLGLIPGLKSPALATLLPNTKGGMTALVDCGANVNIEAANLKDFATLGSAFSSKMFSIDAPKVALLNVGKEKGKGNPLAVESYGLLEELSGEGKINFIGNAEGYDIISGYADVIVCDGFAGNIVLKLTEAVGKTALSIVSAANEKESSKALEDILAKLTELFVLNERGGATFLGTVKPVIKMHGCATEETVVACVDQMLRIS